MLIFRNRKHRVKKLEKLVVRKPVSDRNYLYFQAMEPGATVSLTVPSNFNVSFQYSTDGVNWNNWTYSTVNYTKTFSPITLANLSDYVFIRANGTNTWSAAENNYMHFVLGSSNVAAGGNIMSLYKDDLSVTTLSGTYCFFSLFKDCTSLTTAPELPVETLTYMCYANMFQGCTSLKSAPSLPATTLENYCYINMFYNCTSLTTVPTLSVMSLKKGCYVSMFQGCTSLKSAPSLPATILVESCYNSMFKRCTSLTSAPELPATSLTTACYYRMFEGCIKLRYVKVSASFWDVYNTESWLDNVSPSGTFVKPSGTTILTGANGIPYGWTVVNF